MATRRIPRFLCSTLLFGITTAGVADEIDNLLAQIAKVGPQSASSAQARVARDRLAMHGLEVLPKLLTALDTPNIVAANWYRSIYEELVARELAKPKPNLPVDALKQFANDRKHAGRSRRLVLSLLERIEPAYQSNFVAGMLGDPEFNNDAVDAVLKAGDAAKAAGKSDQAKELFRRAFDHARQADQVLAAADRLQAAGQAVSPVEHMGFIVDWHVIGPFDAPAKTGFGLRFPPETAVDLAAQYPGKEGMTATWKPYHSKDRLGLIDLAAALAPVKEAVGYAYAELEAPSASPAQLRCGADDNLTVWLNGEKVFAREQWLNGIRMDRFVAGVAFQKGTNRVLVKICQGPQHRDPSVPNNWTLQLRFCDASGKAIGLRNTSPGPGKP